MFDKSDKIKDNIKDEVWLYLARLNNRKNWNGESKETLQQLKDLLNQEKYKSFIGHPDRYHLTRIGDSCLYDVPTYRKGALAEFRGQRIRVVCMSSGRYERLLMAGFVGKTPRNKIKVKAKITYVFPETGDHETIYLGRRYKVISAKGEFPIVTYQGSDETIALESCDLIMLDGKECCPIATFKYDPASKLIRRLVGWSFAETFLDLREAIKKWLITTNASVCPL
jgi:hypothetical protein